MSVTFAEAIEIASKMATDVLGASEGSGHWYFEIGDKNFGQIPGGSPVAISKSDGAISFPMPSVPSFVLGNQPTVEESEYVDAVKVPLPY